MRSNRPSASARVLPFTASVMSEAGAVEIAHPCPSNRISSILSSASLRRSVSRSPHRGFTPSALASAVSSGPKFLGRRLWSRITSRYKSFSSMGSLGEERPGARDGRGEPVDLLEGVVEGERSVRGGRYLEEFHHRHGAVMAGADGDAILVEDRAEIVRMHALDDEGHQACLVAGGADDPEPLDPGQGGRRIVEQRVFVRARGAKIERSEKIDR